MAAALAAATGCLHRAEKITIGRDGRVTIEVEYKGDPGDFTGPDALPSKESDWDVTRTEKAKGPEPAQPEEGKPAKGVPQTEVELTATRGFPPGAELPRTFAAPTDPDRDLYLDFPTTLKIEERPDGTYYHFRRVYSPRRWAYANFWKEAIFDEDMQKLAAKDPKELKRNDRIRVLKAFAEVEARKQVEFLREALAQCDPQLAADRFLRVRRALLDVYERIDWDKVLPPELLTQDEEERDKQLQQEAERLIAEGHAEAVKSLRMHAGYEDAQVAAFEKAYARAQRYYQITESHDGHVFGLAIIMPGEVVAHNADEVEQDGTPTWSFGGVAFRDRPHEIMITSRVPREKEGK